MQTKKYIPLDSLPEWVIKGIKKGQEEGIQKQTKSTEAVMKKYLYNLKSK